jgi:hypothetical protein
VFALVVVEHSLRSPEGSFDAWMVWNSRARFLARAGADFRQAFSPRLLFWTHQDYPWLVPGLVAQAFLVTGTESPTIPAAFSACFGVLSVVVVTCALMQLRGARVGLLGGLALATTPCFATFSAGQQADIPLSVYLAISVAILAMAIEDPKRPAGAFMLAGLAAGLCTWTKNEGILHALCLGVALAVRLRDPRATAWFAAGCAPVLTLLIGFKIGMSPTNDFALFTTPRALLAVAVDGSRWTEVIRLMLRHVLYFQDFGLWIAVELLLLLAVVPKLPRRDVTAVLGTALLLSFAGYGLIYVLQPHPLDWIFWSSASRLFMQMWPAVILVTLVA